MTEFEIMTAGEDGWSDWIHPLPKYLMQCCDCGLVHEMETAIVKAHELVRPTAEGEDEDHVIIFRMRRAGVTLEPDPLVEALDEITWTNGTPEMAEKLRAALKARGFEIREKNDD
jgi:hypothetical protein